MSVRNRHHRQGNLLVKVSGDGLTEPVFDTRDARSAASAPARLRNLDMVVVRKKEADGA